MKISYDLIMSFDPCYDPRKIGMRKDYVVTKISDFIIEYRDKVKKKFDIHWTLLRTEFMPKNDLKLFTIWCARQVQPLMTDQRSIDALDVAEKYVCGLATKEEMMNAYDDAWRASASIMVPIMEDAIASPTDAATAAATACYVWSGDAWDAYMASAAWMVSGSAMADKQIDKLLDYFLTVESGKQYDWRKEL